MNAELKAAMEAEIASLKDQNATARAMLAIVVNEIQVMDELLSKGNNHAALGRIRTAATIVSPSYMRFALGGVKI